VLHGASIRLKNEAGEAAIDVLPDLDVLPQPSGKAQWEYFMDDGIDGKQDGWYPFAQSANHKVDEEHTEWMKDPLGVGAQKQTMKGVKSDYFSYNVNFATMLQTNTRSGKTRAIRRIWVP